jgi:hypothetical protein
MVPSWGTIVLYNLWELDILFNENNKVKDLKGILGSPT